MIDPACTLAFENEPDEPDLMQRRLWASLPVTSCYALAMEALPERAGRVTAFGAMIRCNTGLLFEHHERRAAGALAIVNPIFLATPAGALALLALALGTAATMLPRPGAGPQTIFPRSPGAQTCLSFCNGKVISTVPSSCSASAKPQARASACMRVLLPSATPRTTASPRPRQ